MATIDQQLLELYQEITRKQKIRIHLVHLYEIIEKKQHELAQLEQEMDLLEAGIEKLEELNLHSLFLLVLGDKKEQLEKKRQDSLQLFFKSKGVKENLASLEEEKKVLEKTYSSLHAIDTAFDQLLAQKEKILKTLDRFPERLEKHIERIAGFGVKIREIDLAVKKGRVAKKHLHKVVLGLEKIEQWGSGEHPTNPLKKIERINRDIYIANNYLQKYEDELFDISTHFDLNYKKEVENLEFFLDQFIDCLITDWIVSNKIDHSMNLVLNIMDKITRINSMFDLEKEKVMNYIEEEEQMKAEALIAFIQQS